MQLPEWRVTLHLYVWHYDTSVGKRLRTQLSQLTLGKPKGLAEEHQEQHQGNQCSFFAGLSNLSPPPPNVCEIQTVLSISHSGHLDAKANQMLNVTIITFSKAQTLIPPKLSQVVNLFQNRDADANMNQKLTFSNNSDVNAK